MPTKIIPPQQEHSWKILQKTLSILAVVAVSACSGMKKEPEEEFGSSKEVTVQMRKQLLGEWCGEKTLADGTYQKWIMNQWSGGTYRINFTTISQSEGEKTWGEYGLWGIRNPIYFTIMKGFIEDERPVPAPSNEPAFYDAYKVLKLTGDEFIYKSYTSGNTFTVRRSCSANRE